MKAKIMKIKLIWQLLLRKLRYLQLLGTMMTKLIRRMSRLWTLRKVLSPVLMKKRVILMNAWQPT